MSGITSDPRWQEEKPRPTGRRRLWPAVGLAAAAVLTTAAVIGYSQHWGRPGEAGQAQADAEGSSGLDGQVVELPPQDDGTAAALDPTRFAFRDFLGMKLPYSTAYGPRRVTATTASGFTHDLGGAVTAAVHIGVRSAPQVGPEIYGPVVEHQVVGDTATLLAQLDAHHRKAREESGLPAGEPLRTYSQVIGYALPFSDPTGDEVTIHVLFRGPNSSGGSIMVDFPTTLRWLEGDWKLVPPPNWDWPGQPVVLTDGYELFPGMSG